MPVAKVIEIIAESEDGFDEAVKKGIKRAGRTVQNMAGAWIKEQSVVIENGEVTKFRVTMKITFVLQG